MYSKPKLLFDGWPVASAGEAFMDAAPLANITRLVGRGEFPNTHAIVVEHAGALVHEVYFEGQDFRGDEALGDVAFDAGTLHDIRSISKSVTALLLGLALDGAFAEALDTPVLEYFPEMKAWTGPGWDAVLLRHVLTMTAGLEWDEKTHP